MNLEFWNNINAILELGGKLENLYGDNYYVLRNSGKQLHRHDGPAAVHAKDGSLYWYWDGELHRYDAPAVVRSDGLRMWWLHGQFLSQEYEQEICVSGA